MALITAAMTTTMMGNDDDNYSGNDRRVMAATDGMVWGRGQVAGGGGNGNKVEMGTMWV
jgi:hypothetical protein